MRVLGRSRKRLQRLLTNARGPWAKLVGQAYGRAQVVAILVVLGLVVLALALAATFSPRSPTRGLAQTAQFARPALDIATAGAWGTAPLWEKLDEVTADDTATEIQSGTDPNNDPFEVQLSSVTDPQSSVGHIVRYRVTKTGTKAATVDVALYQGATLIRADIQQTVTDLYQTFTFTLTAAEADAIIDYTDLRVRVTANASGPVDPTSVRATWIELEVPEPPTPTPLPPTPTDTPTPVPPPTDTPTPVPPPTDTP